MFGALELVETARLCTTAHTWQAVGTMACGCLVVLLGSAFPRFALLLTWAGRLPAKSRSRLLGSGLIALTLLDVSTVCFWAVRPALHASSPVTDAGLGRELGSLDEGANPAVPEIKCLSRVCGIATSPRQKGRKSTLGQESLSRTRTGSDRLLCNACASCPSPSSQ